MHLTEISDNYDRAARYYDRLTDVVFGWALGLEARRRRAIELLGDVEGATVLDVGCGTGRNLPILVPRVGARGRIVAVDYSEGMLEQASARVDAGGWENVEVRRGDAVKLEGVPEQVDALVCVWCYGIVYDLDAALERALSVLKPGGRLVIMDFAGSRPEGGLFHWLFPLYAAALRLAGIDTARDLDHAALRARWERGRRLLEERLEDVRVETYFNGLGFTLSGRKPR
jgi:demethylmenaquinone methyltransferase/2-methoxy-6-polyprenyl-1,4-benzoquinol methylase